MLNLFECNSVAAMACWVDTGALRFFTMQVFLDVTIWVWLHFLFVVLFLELRPVWFSLKSRAILDFFLGFIPISLLFFNVTVPLFLISLSAFFNPKALWHWYFETGYRIPFYGDVHLFERYFNQVIYQGGVMSYLLGYLNLWLHGCSREIFIKVTSLIFIACYLFFEIIFNAYLIDVAVGSGGYKFDFSDIELVGRCLSSTGVCIFLMGFIKNKKKGYLLVPIVWFSFFMMQKVIVDSLVDLSSGNNRKKSYQFLSLVTASNSLMPLRKFGSSNLFELSILPSSLYFIGGANANELALESLNEYKKQVYGAIKSDLYTVGSPVFYRWYYDFKIANENVRELYRVYGETNKATYLEAEKVWEKMRKGHQQVSEQQAKVDKYFSSFSQKGNELSELLRKTYDGKGCNDQLLNWQYKYGIALHRKYKRFLSNTELCDWQSDKLARPPLFGGNEAYYKHQLLVMMMKPYPVISGVDYNQSFDDVLSNKEFQLELKKGKNDCYIKDILTKQDLVQFYIKCQISKEQDGELKSRIVSIKDNLTFSEFIKNRSVENLVSDYYGLQSGKMLNKLKSDDVDYFESKVFPELAREASSEVESKVESFDYGFFAPKSEFIKKGIFYEVGKESYRYVLILPVVMTLNLFFIAVTFIVFAFKAGTLLYKDVFFKLVLLLGLVSVVFVLPALSQNETSFINGSYIWQWVCAIHPVIYDIGRALK